MKEGISLKSTDITGVRRKYYKLYAHKFNYSNEMN